MSVQRPSLASARWERWFSPILVKEMRSAMRGARFFVGITLFLLLLAAISLVVYLTQASSPFTNPTTMGRTIFGIVTSLESLLLLAIAPSLTAGAIAGERQKQTFEMLMATPLTPGQVLRGKLLAALNYVLLLLVAGIPLNAIVFLFGGVTPGTLLLWMAYLIILVLLLATVGLLISTFVQRSGVATTLSYLINALVFVVGPLMFFFILFTGLFDSGPSRTAECVVAALGMLHPIGGFIGLNGGFSQLGSVMPYMSLLFLIYLSLAALLYLISEARLSLSLGMRWRRRALLLVPLLLMGLATIAVVLGPVRTMCNG